MCFIFHYWVIASSMNSKAAVFKHKKIYILSTLVKKGCIFVCLKKTSLLVPIIRYQLF